MGYDCNVCDGAEPGALLITPLTGGETVALGAECTPVGLVGILGGVLGVDADKLYATIDKFVKAQKRAAEAPAPDDGGQAPPGRQRAARRRPAPTEAGAGGGE